MAAPTIIAVEKLGKRYTLRHQSRVYQTLRETLAHKARQLFAVRRRGANAGPDSAADDFWALKDVSFEIARGDVVGIIGRNGAGKSTLLKILSRIVEPTTGRIRLRGRVASLLEVGTGFHPELSGRENIFLNGAILGMSKGEIRAKFDEIVDFAEVEKFLDTPVKHYSSGMYVRLAFAVAAHLEPEILVVDEVLAVGDAQFQQKCMGKMREVAEGGGRTVLFVSHNLAAVEHLCNTALLLRAGTIAAIGAVRDVAVAYRDDLPSAAATSGTHADSVRPSWATRAIATTTLADKDNRPCARFAIGDGLRLTMSFSMPDGRSLRQPVMGVVIRNSLEVPVGAVNTRMTGDVGSQAMQRGEITCLLNTLKLVPGTYSLDAWLSDGTQDIDVVENCSRFEVEVTDFYRSGVPPFSHFGPLVLEPRWEFNGTPLRHE